MLAVQHASIPKLGAKTEVLAVSDFCGLICRELDGSDQAQRNTNNVNVEQVRQIVTCLSSSFWVEVFRDQRHACRVGRTSVLPGCRE